MNEFLETVSYADDDLTLPAIAVVVIGRNEGQRLIDCLASLASYAGRTVYVDSGSTDGSCEAARRFGVQVVELDMKQPFTAARARNAGYRELCTKWPDTRYVQFVDGDCRVDDDWIATAWRFMAARPDVAIVFGRRRESHPDHSVYNQLCDREWDGLPGDVMECGGDIFVRVQALDAAGGYRASLIAGEEPELCVRLRELGWKIWRLDHEMTLHDANMTTIRQWWQRNRRAGHAFAEVASLHWQSPQGIWKRSFLRTVSWGGVLPVVALAGALVHPAALVLLLLYPLQMVRIAARDGFSIEGWRHGFFGVLGKFAEFHGTATWMFRRLIGQREKLIEYK